jgi:hypothetical protein
MLVEETALKIEHSPDVDEARGFDPGNVSLGYADPETLSRPMAGVIHRGEQWSKPGKSQECPHLLVQRLR